MIAAEPAFPSTVTFVGPCRDDLGDKDIPEKHTEQYVYLGLSVRDYFAAQAMAGYISHKPLHPDELPSFAEAMYLIADAMLAARKKTPWK